MAIKPIRSTTLVIHIRHRSHLVPMGRPLVECPLPAGLFRDTRGSRPRPPPEVDIRAIASRRSPKKEIWLPLWEVTRAMETPLVRLRPLVTMTLTFPLSTFRLPLWKTTPRIRGVIIQAIITLSNITNTNHTIKCSGINSRLNNTSGATNIHIWMDTNILIIISITSSNNTSNLSIMATMGATVPCMVNIRPSHNSLRTSCPVALHPLDLTIHQVLKLTPRTEMTISEITTFSSDPRQICTVPIVTWCTWPMLIQGWSRPGMSP